MAANVENTPRPRRRKLLKLSALLAALVLAGAGGYVLVVRYGLDNFHAIVEGQVYRSAQPDPRDLRKWVSRYGLKTVINLRGKSDSPPYRSEREVLASAAVRLIDIRFTADRLPSAWQLRELIAALEQAERPLLLHCRDGIDRTGMASVIAAMAVGGQDYAAARGQLSWKYLGRGAADGGVTELFTAYEAYCDRRRAGTGAWKAFRDWALTVYHPYYYLIDIAAPKTVRARPDEVIDFPVTLTNRSDQTIPAGREGLSFELVTFRGRRTTSWPETGSLVGPVTYLPKRDIPPGATIEVIHRVALPSTPGRYVFHLDVYARDERQTLFVYEGSPVFTCEATVDGADTPPPAGGGT